MTQAIEQLQTKVAELEEELLKTRLELLTSHGESEELLGRIAELEKENARLRTVPMKYRRMAFNAQLQDENNELRTQLAAEQLNNKLLREALNQWIGIAANCSIESGCCGCGESIENHSHPMMCGHSPVDMADSVVREAIDSTDKALSIPASTEALDKHVAERVKEYQERLANALAVLGADSQIEAEAVMRNYKKQVSTLTKQRDLAIEALEEVRRSGDTRLASMAIAQLTARVRDQGEIGYRQPAPKHSTLM